MEYFPEHLAITTSGLRLGISEVLRSLRRYFWAQSQGHHTIDRLNLMSSGSCVNIAVRLKRLRASVLTYFLINNCVHCTHCHVFFLFFLSLCWSVSLPVSFSFFFLSLDLIPLK